MENEEGLIGVRCTVDLEFMRQPYSLVLKSYK
jgi:hypothetical protein